MLNPVRGRLALILVAAAAAIVVAPLSALPASATTAPGPVQLSMKPLGQARPYFELTLKPGERAHLQVELGNHGPEAIEARTFAADAYSIVNGGFGVRDGGSTPTGATTWLTYTTEVLPLPAGQATIRDLTVIVPEDAAPGEYITALAIENAVPVTGAGDVALDQLVRRAIAVSIRVPGPSDPAFTLGAASHTTVAARSVVSVRISNTGNVDLKPRGQLIIRDSTGERISHAPVTMDSLYAHDTTTVEATLAGPLQPGRYTAGITLKDDATGVARTADLPFVVAPKPVRDSVGLQQGELPQLLLQPGSTADATVPWLITGILVLALAVCAFLLVKAHRRGRPHE
ncbi:hypothetical protein P5G50_17990 [Leifsonia sp. F6_8S_P_1B]|uniref:DUF916 domain-containing protein n=1 Tax=Leifsonia williamsii TaxID=3035919 RepID=A0ABT8KFV9_9MICO|nr:hypothetical protein [Leifsonia williamsii]MDN4616344.1 hypothetical protein [Leifsonia williamsii]